MNVIVGTLVAVLLQAPLQFEVASVKENRSGFGFGSSDFPPNGRVNIENETLKGLMRWSYRLQDYQIIGGPAWVDADRFDIQAKPAADFEPKPIRPCLGPDCPF